MCGGSDCPCRFYAELGEKLGEVTCDPDTQSEQPWSLPDCLLEHVANDQVTKLTRKVAKEELLNIDYSQ